MRSVRRVRASPARAAMTTAAIRRSARPVAGDDLDDRTQIARCPHSAKTDFPPGPGLDCIPRLHRRGRATQPLPRLEAIPPFPGARLFEPGDLINPHSGVAEVEIRALRPRHVRVD